MNLYKIWQDVNNHFDTWDSAVVAAESAIEARKINPRRSAPIDWYKADLSSDGWKYDGWAPLSDIKVKFLGKASKKIKKGIIVRSFNAG